MIILLRYIACILWLIAGIMSQTVEGTISSVASLLFILALTFEVLNKER